MDPLLIILDLDETLVHAADRPLARAPDFVVAKYPVYVRPHLTDFLEGLRQSFRVAVWTAAGADYADAVLEHIIPWRSELVFVWSAERCTTHFDHETRNYFAIKKLRKVKALGHDLRRVLVVDDSPEKHIRNYGNLVQVRPFVGDLSDSELPRVLAYIRALAECPNVRSIEKRFWRASSPV